MMKVILDVDPGIDDAVAMGQILTRKDIDLLAITCVDGNTNVDQTTKNALKVAQAFNRRDVKVYKGASSAFLNQNQDATFFHGNDGLGDAIHEDPDMSQLEDGHAVLAINRLAHEHCGEITIIALGPLTNIALALRLNENLSKQLKEIVIMGGNHRGVGNMTIAAEFNFFCDPIAARIVLEDLNCPKCLVPLEVVDQFYLSLEDVNQYCSRDNERSRFMRRLFESKGFLTNQMGFCDSVAAAVATNRDIVKKSFFKYATVDTDSEMARGMVLIGWDMEILPTTARHKYKQPNVTIVSEIDVEMYREVFLKPVKSD